MGSECRQDEEHTCEDVYCNVKTPRKIVTSRPCMRREENTDINSNEMGCDDVIWMELGEGRVSY
jgi:hypothetical protein